MIIDKMTIYKQMVVYAKTVDKMTLNKMTVGQHNNRQKEQASTESFTN